ncbi:DUF4349 domain-containing protein [Rugosimonospora africana]|nr:DUF4349 domain-containing protein [Rugosimonospora africana]
MRSVTRRWRRATVLITVGLALAAGSAACSADSHSSARSLSGGTAAKAPAAPDGGGNANSKVQVGGNAQAVVPAGKPGSLPTLSRDIIYTGSITVRVNNVDAAAGQLEGLAAAAGGFVGGDTRDLNAGQSTATLVLRIPAEKFGGILDAIGKQLGGHEIARKVSTEDVTDKAIDLDARIRSQQASVDRVRALLAKAESLTDITTIESQLTQREADLESMQAQKRNLNDLTTLSTITVSLLGPEAAVAKPKPKPASGFWPGLKHGWHAFLGALQVLLLILGAVLPFAVVIGVPVLAVLWLRRRRRATRAAVPAPAPETPAV